MTKVLFFIGIFIFFLLPALDPDLGWQLRCGQLILGKSGFCKQNQFSSLLADYQWVNHYWLYQVVLFSVWKTWGLWGLSFLNALVMTAITFLFHQLIKNFQFEKKLIILAIFWLSWGIFSFGIRGQLLGIFYFLATFFFVWQKKEKYLPFLFLFWANSHGSVVFGLAVLFLLLFQSLKNWRKKAVLFILSCLAVLANPSGLAIFQEVWRHLGGVPLSQLIAEWVPLSIEKQVLMALLTLVSLFFLHYSYWPLMIFLFFLSLQARRHLPFFLIGFSLLILRSEKIKDFFHIWLNKATLRKDLVVLISLIFLFCSPFLRLPKTIQSNRSWQGFCQASFVNYPCEAVEFLKKQDKPANIFNSYEWGGFLIWQLPEYKVFVDGRMPAWQSADWQGKSPYTIYLETLQTQPGWQEILDRHNIEWILISPGTFMDLKLRPEPEKFGWQEVYRDKASLIYKKLK